MYQNDNGTISLTQETCDQYFVNATIKSPSIFSGNEVNPSTFYVRGWFALFCAMTVISYVVVMINKFPAFTLGIN